MSGLISGYTGAEGAGKTVLMTDALFKYHQARGKVFAFPGYELYDRKGKVISETIRTEDWVEIPEDLNNVAIGIDEIQNFFDVYQFNSVITRLFGYLAAQRRKRSMCIFYTVQDWGWLPPRLRWLTHFLMTCTDLYFNTKWKPNPIPQGTQILCRMCDLKGFQTGRPGTWSMAKIFFAKRVWDLFKTKSIVDVWEGFTKVEIDRRRVQIANGKVVPDGFDASMPLGLGNPYRGGVSYRVLKDQVMNLFAQKKRWRPGELWQNLGISDNKFIADMRNMLVDWGISERSVSGRMFYVLG